MTIAQLIPLVLTTSITLIVFATGLDASFNDVTWLLHKRGLLARSILSMNVVMVVLAIAVAHFFHLDPAIEIAIVALAISPVPPLFPKKQNKVGATGSYAVALMASAALISIVLIPAWLELLGDIFNFETHPALGKIFSIVFTKIMLPLLAGILVHRFLPKLADRAVKPISMIATILLVLGVIAIIFASYRAMWAMLGNGVLITVVLFAVVGIIVGHFLGGPDPGDRSILALATSARHPAIAISIAALNFPERKSAVLIVVLFHLIVGAIVAAPYMAWRKKARLALET